VRAIYNVSIFSCDFYYSFRSSGLSMGSDYHSDCVCGRSFLQPGAFTKHKRTCQSSKKRLASALDKAKQLWKGSKRRRLEIDSSELKQLPLAAGLVLESQVAPSVSMEVRLFFVC
jgi:hypothetical protein